MIFDELNTACPGIGGLVSAAQAVPERPQAVLQEAALFSCQLVKSILAFEGLEEAQGDNQIVRLNRLANRGYLPPILLPFFHVINAAGILSGGSYVIELH